MGGRWVGVKWVGVWVVVVVGWVGVECEVVEGGGWCD